MSRIHSDARAAGGKNSTPENDVPASWAEGTIKSDGPAVNNALLRLQSLRAQKNDLAQQESDIFKELEGIGHTKRAIKYVIALEKMDPDDRADYLAEIDSLLTFKQWW